MLPFIAAGTGFVALGSYIYKQKSICNCCKSKFTLNEQCVFCGELLCGGCGTEVPRIDYRGINVQPKGRCCIEHVASLEQQNAERKVEIDAELERQAIYARRRAAAAAKTDQVKLHSKSYAGSLKPPKHNKWLETPYLHDQDDARNELIISALLEDMDCTVIQQVTLTERKIRRGNFIKRAWSARGLI